MSDPTEQVDNLGGVVHGDLVMPAVPSEWTDAAGRTLTVHEVEPGDPLGREVRGVVQAHTSGPSGGMLSLLAGLNAPLPKPQPYSCSLLIWGHIWRDQAPAWDHEGHQ